MIGAFAWKLLLAFTVLRTCVTGTNISHAYILISPCGYGGNVANVTYSLHAPEGITWVRLLEVPDRDEYHVITLLEDLRTKTEIDLIIMSHDLFRASPRKMRTSLSPTEVISLTTLSYPPYAFSPACVEERGIHEIPSNDWWTDHVIVIANVILKRLLWSSVYIFHEANTQHLMDVLSDILSENDIFFTSFLVENMSESEVTGILRQMESGSNFLVLCLEQQASFLLSVASRYSMTVRDSAIRHLTYWLLLLISDDVTNDRMFTNVTLDNLATVTLDTQTGNDLKICDLIAAVLQEGTRDIGVCENGTETLKCSLASRLQDITSVWREYPIQTLLWRSEGRELSAVGTVNLNGDVILHANIFPNKDFGFNGRKLIISTQSVFDVDPLTELCLELLSELAIELNFTYDLVPSPDGDYGVMMENGSWTGLIGQLQRWEVDLVASALTINMQREYVMDFIHPFIDDQSLVVIKKPDPQERKWRTLIDPYSTTVLICIGLSLPLAAIVLLLLENASPFYMGRNRQATGSDLNTYLGSFWYLFGALLTQGGKFTPVALSSRLFVSMWWLFCMISLGIYSGNLIASLTIPKEKMPFRTLQGMVSQDTYTWGTYGGTIFVTMFKDSMVPVFNDVWKGIVRFNATDPSVLSKDPNQHIRKVLGGYYAYVAAQTEISIHMSRHCGLATIDEHFLHMKYSFGLPNNSPYTNIFSLKIMKILETGLMHAWKRKGWVQQKLCYAVNPTQKKVISLVDVQSAFYLIGTGIGLGTLVIGVECFYTGFLRRRTRKK